MKRFLLSSILLVSLMSGCVGIPGQYIQNEAPPTPVDALTPYRIGVGDNIAINVWRNPELSQTTTVRPDGFISMPLMGDLKADGRRPEEMADEISTALSAVIRSPEVTVVVNNPTSQEFLNRVRATGQVTTPVSIPHRQGMTVMDIILQAGGVSDFGAGNRATLQRRVEGEVQWYSVRLDDILEKGDMRTNFKVYPGDVISVPKKQLIKGEF